MPAHQNFNTVKVTRMSEAFPQAVITDSFFFLSGTPGLDPATGKVISDAIHLAVKISPFTPKQ
ncbi:MAG TPA: hypothetical protein VKH37_02235 [Ferruginibacter sp.]|nr:hypothetical protein [Ferruginibacter sp.]